MLKLLKVFSECFYHLKKLRQLNKHFITNQLFVMNEQNLQYLKDNIKYLGFGEKFQSIYLNKGQGVTMKEAYNLLNGRAVHKELANKEGEKYQAWLQLDFKQTDSRGNYKIKQFHQNFGYDVEKALSAHPIKELQNEQEKARLVESLKKGNRQSVTFIENGNQQKAFVEANPQFKSINVYDSQMRRMNKQSRKETQSEGETTQQKVAKKTTQNKNDEETEGPKKITKQRTKRKQSIS